MSWDISIMKFSRNYRSVADISEIDKPLELGDPRPWSPTAIKRCGAANFAIAIRRDLE
jgi:hypothetical protein